MFSVLHREKRTRVQRKVGLRCGLVLVDPCTSTAKTGKEHLHEYLYRSAVPYDSYYFTSFCRWLGQLQNENSTMRSFTAPRRVF